MGLAHVRARRLLNPVFLRRAWREIALISWAGFATLLSGAGFATLLAPRCDAHDFGYSQAEVRWVGARVELTIALRHEDASALIRAAGDSGSTRPFGTLEDPRSRRLAATVASRIRLVRDGVALPVRAREVTSLPEGERLVFQAVAAGDRPLTVEGPLFDADRPHETFLTIDVDGLPARHEVLAEEHPRVDIERDKAAGSNATSAFARYVGTGVHHIAIGPDHILFIVGLVLMGGGFRQILKLATAFTAAHSLTLALAVLGLARPPSFLVEPAIALSIVYVGIANLRRAPGARDDRVAVAFGFGLLHGFGFASVLRDVGLPRESLAFALLGFNAGVEIGQVAVVTLSLGALALASGLRVATTRTVARVGSCVTAAVGAVWFVQRVASLG